MPNRSRSSDRLRVPSDPGRSAVAEALRDELEAAERGMSARRREQIHALTEEAALDLYCQVNHGARADALAARERARARQEELMKLFDAP